MNKQIVILVSQPILEVSGSGASGAIEVEKNPQCALIMTLAEFGVDNSKLLKI